MPNFGTEIDGRKYRAPWTPMLVMSPVGEECAVPGNAVRDEDDRRRTALGEDQSRPDGRRCEPVDGNGDYTADTAECQGSADLA